MPPAAVKMAGAALAPPALGSAMSEAVLWAGVLFWGSDQSAPPLGWLAVLFPGADKLIHAGLYLVLGALCCRALLYGLPSGHRPVRRIALAAGLAALYGLSAELHQGWVPGRQVQALDLMADAMGGLLGALLWVRLQPLLSRLTARRGDTAGA